MYHYTYKIYYSTGKMYIGARSSKKKPEDDVDYVGSSKITPNDLITEKRILKVFSTRKEAIEHEVFLHRFNDVKNSDKYYNQVNQTTSKFDCTGVPKTDEHKRKIANTRLGKKRTPEECRAISIGKKRQKRTYKMSEETKRKIAKANKGKINHMRNKKYLSDGLIKHYSKRCKYNKKYVWFNRISKQIEKGTCQEMGIKHGCGVKPTRCFRDIVNGNVKSYKGWVIETELD